MHTGHRRRRRAIPCCGGVTAYAARLRGCPCSRGVKGLAAAGRFRKCFLPLCCDRSNDPAGARERTPRSCWVWGHAQDRRGADFVWEGLCRRRGSASVPRAWPSLGTHRPVNSCVRASAEAESTGEGWTRAFARLPQMSNLRDTASTAGVRQRWYSGRACAGIRRRSFACLPRSLSVCVCPHRRVALTAPSTDVRFLPSSPSVLRPQAADFDLFD